MTKKRPNLLLATNSSYGSNESPARENTKETASPTVKALKLLGANKPYGNT